MKTTLALLFSLFWLSTVAQIDAVRISQVYPGGGNQGASYNQDFIELFNITQSSIDISGWSVQYASAAGPGGNGDWATAVIPAGTIMPVGKYFLVAFATGATGAALPKPDLVMPSIDLAATAGKIALVKNASPLNGPAACADPSIADLVGYGTTASCFRIASAPTAGINSTRSLQRGANGCLNLFNNSTDFSVAAVVPRNSASPGWSCYGPTLIVGYGSAGLFTTPGLASEAQPMQLSGFGLTGAPGTITVNAGSPDFEISLSRTAGFAPALTLPFTSFSLDSAVIYLRIRSTAPMGKLSALVTFTGGGAQASVTVVGNVLAVAPTMQAGQVVFSNIAATSFDINWVNGNGTSRLVLLRQSATGAAVPANGTSYTGSFDIASAAITGPGNFVLFSGAGTGPISVSGLSPGTNYSVSVYEFNGNTGSANYDTASTPGNPATVTTTGSSTNLVQANFTSVFSPLYMASQGIPTMFYATVSKLLPNTTYRYFTQGAVASDIGTQGTGAGAPILIHHLVSPPVYYYTSNPSINNYGGFGQFTTNDTGSFSGSFGFVGTTDSRFTPGTSIIPSIAISADASTVQYRFALDQTIRVLALGSDEGPTNGSFLQGSSSSTPGNLVAIWDNTTATGRPLGITIAENRAFTPVDGNTPWQTGFADGYDDATGAWNTIIPNNNPAGVRLIQQLEYRTGRVMGCSQDGNGNWPTGSVSTSDPQNGSTPVQVSQADAPLNNGSCFGIPNLTQVNFTATAASAPLFTATGNTQRLPTMFYAVITNLAPYTTYRYYTQAAIGSDLGTASTGAGNSILIDYTSSPVRYTYASSPSLNISGGYGRFTTDGEGSFKGSFGFVNTGNARFTAGNDLLPAIAITVDAGSPAIFRFALNQTIRALRFGKTGAENEGSFIRGSNSGGAGKGSLVAIWDNTAANGRPLSITLVELNSLATGNGGTAWRTGFINGYDSSFGSWNVILPNSNPKGARLIQSFELSMGNVSGCSADDDGTWPTGPVVTSNPTSGSTPLVIAVADAPLEQGSCYNILPVQLEYIKAQKNGTGNVLHWKVTCLSNSIVMHMERAADRRNFSAIGSIAATQARCGAPFDYTDQHPLPGNNYYRVKMIDIDGRTGYSPVVIVINANTGVEIAGLYPSLVRDFASLSVSASKSGNIETSIVDMSGRIVSKRRIALSAGNNLVKIDCSRLAAGIYQLSCVADDNSSRTTRFVKE